MTWQEIWPAILLGRPYYELPSQNDSRRFHHITTLLSTLAFPLKPKFILLQCACFPSSAARPSTPVGALLLTRASITSRSPNTPRPSPRDTADGGRQKSRQRKTIADPPAKITGTVSSRKTPNGKLASGGGKNGHGGALNGSATRSRASRCPN